MRTHYDVLQVSENASQELIETAYQAVLKQCNPERYPGGREKAMERIAEVVAAYEVLSSPERRRQYSAQRAEKEVHDDERVTFNLHDASSDVSNSRRSFQAQSVGADQGSGENKSYGHALTSLVGSIWRGEIGLGKTYWLYGVVGSNLFGALVFLVFCIPVALLGDDFGFLFVPAIVLIFAYAILILVGVWRSAGKGGRLGFWGVVARGYCISLVVVPIIGVAAAIVIPAAVDGRKTQASASALLPPQDVVSEPADPVAPPAPVATYPSAYTGQPSQEQAATSPAEAEWGEHFRKIYAAHPDAKAIVGSDAFATWVAKDNERGRVVDNGAADEVIRLLEEYKARSPEEKFEDVVYSSYRRYPFLDVGGSRPNRQAIDEVVKLRDYYMERGWSAHEGLEKAVSEVAPKYQHAQSPTPTQQAAPQYQATPPPRYPDCEYKQIMTDEDMRACGLEPKR